MIYKYTLNSKSPSLMDKGGVLVESPSLCSIPLLRYLFMLSFFKYPDTYVQYSSTCSSFNFNFETLLFYKNLEI